MRKDFSTSLIIVVVLAIISAAVYYVIIPNLPQTKTTLRLGDGVFTASVAIDEASRTRGLSGTTELKPDQALIMAYPTSDKWGVGMKDMNYPIDIVWLDSNKNVVDIFQNATADSPTLIHMPRYNADYVIELPAGTVTEKVINFDKTAVFQLNIADVK